MCDFDSPQLYRESFRKARKNHRCGECLSTIQPKEYYHHFMIMTDGDFDNYKMCSECHEISKILNKLPEHICWCFGELLFHETVGQIETPGMKFKVLRRTVVREKNYESIIRERNLRKAEA
jgi:hypothetical protein